MKLIICFILCLAGCATQPKSPVDQCGADKDYIFEDGKCTPVSNEELYDDAYGSRQEVPMTEGYED